MSRYHLVGAVSRRRGNLGEGRRRRQRRGKGQDRGGGRGGADSRLPVRHTARQRRCQAHDVLPIVRQFTTESPVRCESVLVGQLTIERSEMRVSKMMRNEM